MSHIWTTADEVVFVRGIGAHSATRTPRRLLLEQYRHAAANRVDWGGLQPDIILTEVCRQLERFTRSAR
jgi:hypothetical protein